MKRLGAALILLTAALAAVPALAQEWTAEELAVMRSFWIGSLPPLRPDPTNEVGDDPRAAEFGHRLFFDTRLSANGAVACASCHKPELAFADGSPMSKGIGSTTRNAPTIVGAAYNDWFFWDGRKDSQWSQALGPLENPAEHGMTRDRLVELVLREPDYRDRYRDLFGALPRPGEAAETTRAFVNLGKAIAAYERRLLPGPGKFDRYAEAVLNGREPAEADRLTLSETLGFRIFTADNLGKCTRCHSGPLLTDGEFHNIGLDLPPNEVESDFGRLTGIKTALADPFNCLGPYAGASYCAELLFARRGAEDLRGAFKTPTLRNLAHTAPYMHTGEFGTLEKVLWHYNQRPAAMVGRTELEQLTLAGTQFEQINAFLLTLDGPINAPARFLRPPETGSGSRQAER